MVLTIGMYRNSKCWKSRTGRFHRELPAGFVVQKSCGRWSEIDQQFMFEDMETERWPLLIDAEKRYEVRRLALVEKDFGPHSRKEFSLGTVTNPEGIASSNVFRNRGRF